jgi:proteasome lid subunit RPN8/RPN11
MTLTPSQWAAIAEHLTANLPEEACGLLAGGAARAEKVYLITNTRHSAVRYEMAPGELLAAFEEIDAHNWQLQAIFHSHPHGPAEPSPTDIAEAYYPDSAYIICAPADGGWQARAFEIQSGKVREIPLAIQATTRQAGPGC